MSTDEVYMTLEQAEDIIMANEVGMFTGNRSQLAHAILLVSTESDSASGAQQKGEE